MNFTEISTLFMNSFRFFENHGNTLTRGNINVGHSVTLTYISRLRKKNLENWGEKHRISKVSKIG